MSELTVGDAVPPFELPLDDGSRFHFASLRGKPLVLFFYPKDDTSGCTLEAIDFTALASEFEAAGIGLLGISPDDVKSHCRFKEKHSLSVPLAADVERQVIDRFGVWKEKSMYGKRYMGVERSTFLVGADGRVAREWRKVSVPGHAAEVLEAAKDLAGKGT